MSKKREPAVSMEWAKEVSRRLTELEDAVRVLPKDYTVNGWQEQEACPDGSKKPVWFIPSRGNVGELFADLLEALGYKTAYHSSTKAKYTLEKKQPTIVMTPRKKGWF